jgi:hypothetical protein
MKLFFRYEFNVFFNLTKNGLIVGDKILTHLLSVTIVFSYYNFNYGVRLSRYIGSRHFSPEEQKQIYRPVALKGLKIINPCVVVLLVLLELGKFSAFDVPFNFRFSAQECLQCEMALDHHWLVELGTIYISVGCSGHAQGCHTEAYAGDGRTEEDSQEKIQMKAGKLGHICM